MAIHKAASDCFAALAMTLGLLTAVPASAQTFPPLTGRVVDQANLLTPEQRLDITSKSAALEAQTGRQFVVATVSSLEGRPIEDYGYRLGRSWGIGRKGEDDGVILLVAPNEKKVRIEVGYGATAFLTDAVSSVIIRNSILPEFRKGDFGAGIVAGSDQIIAQMSLPADQAKANVARAEQAQQERRHSSGGALPVIFWAMVIGFVLLSMARRGGGRRYRGKRRGGSGISPWIVLWGLNELGRSGRGGGWGGGGGGFGGFSGGGGSFGGGGASGSW